MEKPYIVMKFGGTSVGTAERLLKVVDIVRAHMECYRPIIVLSAMSSENKSAGTTSRLMEATKDLLIPNSTVYFDIANLIEKDHVAAANAAIPDLRIRNLLVTELRADIQLLKNFLEAAKIIDEISPRTKDVIIGTGEKLVCRLFSSVLSAHAIPSCFINLDKICTDAQFLGTDENMLDQHFYDILKDKLAMTVQKESTSEEGGYLVPVVTGFLGYIPGGILNAIGRGYTDFTAALIAAGLKSNASSIAELQIWKEVEGIYTADPRKVRSARLLASIYPDEAAELTYYGSEVIHPFTMEQVIRVKVPIRIKNTFNPSGPGTCIQIDDIELLSHVQPHHTLSKLTPSYEPVGIPITATAVTLKSNVFCLNVHSNRKSVSHGFLAKIFSTLDRYGIIVDLISTSEVHVSMVLSYTVNNLVATGAPSRNDDTSKLDLLLRDLRPLGTVSLLRNMAILSLVGRQMKNMVGIAGKMFSVLAKEGVNIEMISQGASEVNISCVVLEEDALRALTSIHDACVIGI